MVRIVLDASKISRINTIKLPNKSHALSENPVRGLGAGQCDTVTRRELIYLRADVHGEDGRAGAGQGGAGLPRRYPEANTVLLEQQTTKGMLHRNKCQKKKTDCYKPPRQKPSTLLASALTAVYG